MGYQCNMIEKRFFLFWSICAVHNDGSVIIYCLLNRGYLSCEEFFVGTDARARNKTHWSVYSVDLIAGATLTETATINRIQAVPKVQILEGNPEHDACA